MGTSSLALAEEGTKYGNQMETGKLSQEPSVLGNKREPVRADDATKREPVPDEAMKGEKVPQRTYSGEGARYGDQMEPTGKLSQEPSVLGNKREPVRPNDAMAMKGEKKEHKEKTKAHKEAAKTAPAAPAPAP
jgi:hypothetical protein